MLFFLTFSYTYMVEKIFSGQIFEMLILMDLHPLRSLESENHILGVELYVCLYYQQNSKTNNSRKLQIWYSTFISCVDAS